MNIDFRCYRSSHDTVLPLFKNEYPEINSENSWNFTKYPEILRKVPVFYINCTWCYRFLNLFLFSKLLFCILGNPQKFLKIPEFREKWKHWYDIIWKCSIRSPIPAHTCSHALHDRVGLHQVGACYESPHLSLHLGIQGSRGEKMRDHHGNDLVLQMGSLGEEGSADDDLQCSHHHLVPVVFEMWQRSHWC